MDNHESYDLSPDHKVRYFWPDADPARLLKRVRRFIKDNQGATVESIDINHRWDDEMEDVVFEATVVYLGVAN